MTFKDDDQTILRHEVSTINNSYDVISVRFQMRQSEFDLIKSGLKADMEYFLEWLQPKPE
jgi:hypothetical protein